MVKLGIALFLLLFLNDTFRRLPVLPDSTVQERRRSELKDVTRYSRPDS
jgi:hypothetical protein